MQERNKNYIKKLSIQGFRGFKDKETVNFAYPDKEGHCGLNIIVGQNCSGKSTIIEAIKLLMQSNQRGYFLSKATKNLDVELNIEMENINCVTKLQTTDRRNFAKMINIRDGSPTDAYIGDKNYFLVPSRKNVVNNNLYNNNDSIENFLMNYQNNANRTSINRRNTNLNNEFMSVLTTIYADEKKKLEFDKILKRFFKDITWNLYMSDEQDNSFVVDIQDKCGSTHFEGVGDGIITIIYICVGLFMLEQNLISVLLIDEPEVSLHTEIIKKISEVLREYSEKYQIIISTHSPYLIDWKAIKNGGKLIRTVNEERIRIYELENNLIEKKEMNPSTNPHMYGTTAKEVFFLKDKIVLLEGQEDVVCYNKILEKLSQEGKYNFYGWGAGGAKNIRLIMRILKSLGYKKIVGIFDGDNEGKEEAKNCNMEFESEYKAFNICTEDIRDKYICIYNEETLEKEKEVLKKEGVFDKKLSLKNNFDEKYKESFINIFSEIDKYFEEDTTEIAQNKIINNISDNDVLTGTLLNKWVQERDKYFEEDTTEIAQNKITNNSSDNDVLARHLLEKWLEEKKIYEYAKNKYKKFDFNFGGGGDLSFKRINDNKYYVIMEQEDCISNDYAIKILYHVIINIKTRKVKLKHRKIISNTLPTNWFEKKLSMRFF